MTTNKTNTQTPKQRREALEETIQSNHDWQNGQVRQWEACGVTATDTCAICGLQRTWRARGQNSGTPADTYADPHGGPLTLAEAAARGCA